MEGYYSLAEVPPVISLSFSNDLTYMPPDFNDASNGPTRFIISLQGKRHWFDQIGRLTLK